MTPLEIKMLLHIHCLREPYVDRGGTAQREAFEWFLDEGLIEEVCQDSGARVYASWYRTTERGAAMVKKLCNVQLPVAVWT